MGRGTAKIVGRLTVAIVLLATACAAGRGRSVRVVVPAGATLRVASESLARAGVLAWPRFFRLYALVRHDDRSIKAGTYLFRPGLNWNDVLDALRGGKGLMRTITIPEGWSLRQIVPALAAKLDQPVDSVDAAVRDTATLHRLEVPTPTLEGYLFPDTYSFPDGTTARMAVQTMVHQFELEWKPAWTIRLDSVPLSRHDVLTLASIVEKEAKLPEERPVIAAVYMNRLRAGMLLQADPTIQYALGQHQRRVYYKDLEVRSPYNTYRHPGLPPGPVGSPGAASIAAALYPASVPYEYFVALPDGHHEFRKDLRGHSLAKRDARRAWDSSGARARRGDGSAPASRSAHR